MDDELPEEAIEAAEDQPSAHGHDGLDDDQSMLAHLRSAHGLEAPEHLSGATLAGLHDRLHEETDAAHQKAD